MKVHETFIRINGFRVHCRYRAVPVVNLVAVLPLRVAGACANDLGFTVQNAYREFDTALETLRPAVVTSAMFAELRELAVKQPALTR